MSERGKGLVALGFLLHELVLQSLALELVAAGALCDFGLSYGIALVERFYIFLKAGGCVVQTGSELAA